MGLLVLISSKSGEQVRSNASELKVLDEPPICRQHNEVNPKQLHNIGSFGNVFDVLTKQYSVKVLEISFLTDLFTNLTFHVWTKPGTYKNKTSSEVGWTKVAEGSTNGLGISKPTPIPKDSFSPFWIGPREIQSFMVVLDTPDIRYNYGMLEGSIVEINSDLLLLEGKAIGKFPPFTTNLSEFFTPRVFTGAIKYFVEKPCNGSTARPSLLPSTMPSVLSSLKPSLSPSLNPTSSPPTALPSISFSSKPTTILSVEPSSRPTLSPSIGPSLHPSFLPSVVSSWNPTLGIQTASIEFTYLFVVDFDEIPFIQQELKAVTENITKDAFEDRLEVTKALQDIVKRGDLEFEGVTSSSILDSFEHECSNTDPTNACIASQCTVQISYGNGVSVSEVRYVVLQLSEVIHNRLTFTRTEYIGPKPIETTRSLRIKGLFYEDLEDAETILFLENTVREFLSSVQDQADIASVKVVAKQMKETDLESPLFRRFLHALNARHRQHHSRDTSSVDLEIFVTGEYLPPPEIDFGHVVEDSFDNEGDTFIDLLKAGENEYLKRITKIETTEDSTSSNGNSTSISQNSTVNTEGEKDLPSPTNSIAQPNVTPLKALPIIITLCVVCIFSIFYVLVWRSMLVSIAKDESDDTSSNTILLPTADGSMPGRFHSNSFDRQLRQS